MIRAVLGFLRSLKLSLTEWCVVAVVGVVGALVTALKVQGSQLHRTQLKLLSVQINAKEGKAEEEVSQSIEAYNKALADFRKAGGVLLLALTLALPAHATDPAVLLPKCESALSACDKAVESLKAQVVVLKDSEKQWKRQATAPGEEPIVLLTTIAGGMGGALGGVAANSKGGLAPGGIVGTVLGFAFGLIVRGGR